MPNDRTANATLVVGYLTSLIKMGLGTSEALVNWAVNTTCEAAFDRFKILSQFVEDGDRQGAVDWLKRQRFQTSKAAAARGTDLHKAAELLALGQQPKVEPNIQPYLDQYVRFLEQYEPEFLMAEAPIYAPTRGGYAGTLDAIARIDGSVVVADVKTTPHAPDSGRSRPPYEETALQLCLYRHAELVGVLAERKELARGRYYAFDPSLHHEPMPETSGAVVITVSPYDFVVTPVRTDDAVYKAARHVIEAARWRVETSRTVIGPPIRPTNKQEMVA